MDTLLLTHYLESNDACMTIQANFIDDGTALAKYSVTPEFEDDMLIKGYKVSNMNGIYLNFVITIN